MSAPLPCKSGKLHKMGASTLCTMDDANCFHMIRLELKTSVNGMNVTVVSTASGCDVTTVQQHYKGSTSMIGCTRPVLSLAST